MQYLTTKIHTLPQEGNLKFKGEYIYRARMQFPGG